MSILKGFAGTVGNFGLNQFSDSIGSRRQQRYNERNMELQQKYQKEMVDYIADKNSPMKSVARWRAAGVSPVGIYGSSPGGAGISSDASAPSSSNPDGGSSRYDFVRTAAEQQRMENERKVADSQADLNSALADKARGDTKDPDITKRLQLLDLDRSELAKESERIQKDILDIEKGYKEYEKQADLSIKQQILFETMAKIDKLLADKEVSEETKKKLQADRDLIQEQINTEKAKQRNLDAQTDTENQTREGRKSLTNAQAKEALSRAGLNSLARDRDSYEFFLRLVNADDVKSPAQAVSKFVRMFKSRFNRDLADYQRAALSDYLEKIWSGEMP